MYILKIILKKHKTLPYVPDSILKRRKDKIVEIPRVKTKFASIQYNKRSVKLYNKINKDSYIYSKPLYECKKIVKDWVKPLTYDEVEALLQ